MPHARLLTPILCGVLMAGAAQAQTNPSSTTPGQTAPAQQSGVAGQANQASQTAAAVANNTDPAPLTEMDKNFLRDVARGANFELAMAKLAEQKAHHADVKVYSRTVAHDHEQMNGALHQLAQKSGYSLPTGMAPDQQTVLNRLGALNGEAFDKAYVQALKEINGRDSSAMKKELDTTQNTAVKAFIQQMQAADSKHEEMAKKLQGYS